MRYALPFILASLVIVLPMVRLPRGWEATLQHAALILRIVLIGWTAILLVNHFAERSMRRYRLAIDDNLAARKYVTQVRVLRRTVNIVLFIFTLGAVLLTFESVQRYGVSLFASAGAAGLILLETNTQPGMTATSLVPEQAQHVGISFPDLCAWMVEDASCGR